MLFPPPPTRSPKHVLRDYQRKAIDATLDNIALNPILVSPTGSGKTVMGKALVAELAVPTLWLAHRTELIEQAAKQFQRCGIIKSGYPETDAEIQVASVQTLIRRQKPTARLIVIDECHHVGGGNSYQTILDAYPGVPVVGLTATPFRLDGRGLGQIFKTIVVSAYPDELIAQGWLHAPKVYAGSPPDLRGVIVTGGDYNLGELAKRMNNDADVVGTWQQRAAGRRTIAFAVDIDHSKRITKAFSDAGVPAEHLDGSTPADERSAILARLKSGETLIVSNCMVLTEGWDLPALECAIIARPTASLNLHLQMIGRVMRAADGKAGAVVLDHAGNHHVHGLVTRRLAYSLDGSVRIGEADPLGLRQCRQCFVLYDSKLKQCPECGHVPTPVERTAPGIHGDGVLGEFNEDFTYRRAIWNLIEAEREANDYKPGWSLYRYEERFGSKPVLAGRELVDPQNATMEQKRQVYEFYLDLARAKGLKEGFASHRYREIFGCWPRGFVEDSKKTEIRERWVQRA